MKLEITPASMAPTLSPEGHAVFQAVLEAMQDAEEIWGPTEADDYRELMTDIAEAARGGQPAPGWQDHDGIYQRTITALQKGLDLERYADFQALCARTAAEAEQRISNSLTYER